MGPGAKTRIQGLEDPFGCHGNHGQWGLAQRPMAPLLGGEYTLERLRRGVVYPPLVPLGVSSPDGPPGSRGSTMNRSKGRRESPVSRHNIDLTDFY